MSKQMPGREGAALRTLKLFKWKETQLENTIHRDVGLFLFHVHGAVFTGEPGSGSESFAKEPARMMVIPFKIDRLRDLCTLAQLAVDVVSATCLFQPVTIRGLAKQMLAHIKGCYRFDMDKLLTPSSDCPRLVFVADLYTVRIFEEPSMEEKVVAPLNDLKGNHGVNALVVGQGKEEDHDDDNVVDDNDDYDDDDDLIGDSDMEMDMDDDKDGVDDGMEDEEDRSLGGLFDWGREEFEHISVALIKAYQGVKRTFPLDHLQESEMPRLIEVGSKLEFMRLQEGEEIEDATNVCAICLDGLKTEQWLIELQCQHVFHHLCIFKWLPEKHSCPMCRSCSITSV